jgi:polysaccharide export outer membrane protein
MSRILRASVVLFVVWHVNSVPVVGQEKQQQGTPQGAQGPRTLGSPGEDYRIGPGDMLMVSVFGLKEFEQGARVSNSGKIHLTHVGILNVSDKTVAEVEHQVAAKLREKELVRDPWVKIRMAEYRAHPVYILGEVMQPGQFILTGEMYLTDLITQALGFNEVASPVGYLYRRKPVATRGDAKGNGPQGASDLAESVTVEAIPIDFQKLQDNPDQNVRLRAGDVLYCPERRRVFYFVLGEVLKPGLYELPHDKQVLLSQAIAQSGGPARTAKLSKGILVRYDVQGRREEIAFDFAAVMQGRQPDLPIRLNDVIFVPGSTIKTLGYGLLGIVPGVVGGNIIQ